MNAATEKLILKTGRELRHLAVRNYHNEAKALMPSINEDDYHCWFRGLLFKDERGPQNPSQRLIWLIEVRRDVRTSIMPNPQKIIRLTAAIYTEIRKIKVIKNLPIPAYMNEYTTKGEDK